MVEAEWWRVEVVLCTDDTLCLSHISYLVI